MKSDLYVAVIEGQIKTVSDFISKGYNVNEKNCYNDDTLLHTAVRRRYLQITKLLIDAGCNVNKKNNCGEAPLHLALQNVDIAKLLVDAGADVNIKKSTSGTPLHLAVRSMNFDISKLLVDAGAEVDAKDKGGKTPLYFAVLMNNIDITKLLLDANADVRARCNSGEYDNPLELAIKSSNVNILKLFINSGMDLRTYDEVEYNPLSLAVVYENFHIVKLMIDAGANVNAKDEDEDGDEPDSPLKLALMNNNFDIFKLIIENENFCVNKKDSWGDTPLHYAAEYDNSSSVKLLLDAGANVHAKNDSDESPLHPAIYSENVNILKLLVNAGADLNAVDEHELDTPLHRSVRLRNENIVKFLLEAGSNVNAINSSGFTPLHIAANYKNVNVIKLLIKNGVNVNMTNEFGDSALLVLGRSLKDLKSQDTQNMEKKLRLLLEYTDVNLTDNTGKNVLSKIFETLRYSQHMNFYHEIILEHIATFKILNFQLDPRLLSSITRFNDYNEYFTKCKEELEAAKNTKLRNSWVTFLNLLLDDKKKFVKYAGNEDLVKDFEERAVQFPIYGAKMKSNVMKGVQGRKLFDNAANVLTKCLPIFNPTHLIIRGILDVLSKKDWSSLC